MMLVGGRTEAVLMFTNRQCMQCTRVNPVKDSSNNDEASGFGENCFTTPLNPMSRPGSDNST